MAVFCDFYSLSDFDWVWDEDSKSSACHLKQDHREVMFHMDYSCGTAAVRGTVPMKENQHYWEVKMTSTVYGTDMVREKIFWLSFFIRLQFSLSSILSSYSIFFKEKLITGMTKKVF